MDIRHNLLTFADAGIQAVNGNTVIRQVLPDILDSQWKNITFTELQIIAIGKAADAMLQGALAVMNDLGNINSQSLLISKTGHISPECYENPAIICIESEHPVPGKGSLVAGKALIHFLESSESACLVLISGGTSSLVEVLEKGWDLQELQAVTQWMLANAYTIEQMNAVRSAISSIKRGGLWRYLQNRPVICLMISDVPNDNVGVIGSGLLFPDQTHTAYHQIPDSLPSKWRKKLTLPKTRQIASTFFWHVIANNQQAREGVVKKASQKGYHTKSITSLQLGDAEKVAKKCINELKKNPDTIIIWGAETTVVLPENPGKGGRNQQVALAAAIEIAGKQNVYLLAIGTDGTDGVTEDAGALVDSETLYRASLAGFNAKQSLSQADANRFLRASGDLIFTGVTGTNVMDLIIGYYAQGKE